VDVIQDKTKSNTFIPLPYVDVRITKGRLKQLITSTKPYGRVKPVPYEPKLSFKLSQFAYHLLNEAEFESFLDLLIQDALIYTGAPFQVTWGTEYKEMPVKPEIILLPSLKDREKQVAGNIGASLIDIGDGVEYPHRRRPCQH